MSGAGELVGGAALGTLFSAVYEGIEQLIKTCLIYKHLLKSITSRLKSLEPLIKQIALYNEELDRPKEELEGIRLQLEEGEKLVQKCSKVRSWSVYKKYKYAKRLLDWDESLKSQLDVLNVQGIRDVKENSNSLRKIEQGIKRIESDCLTRNQSLSQAWCAVPELPPLTVGLDVPLKELKKKLLKADGVSMLVLTAPGGCGKTTLATKFCQDDEVKGKFGNNIFFVSVSQKPNLDLIVKELYEHKGAQVPTLQNEVNAVKWLQHFLKEEGQHPLLLVLDDVWSGSESLLDKFQFEMSNYKVLVTSRSEFPRFGSSYYLPSLDYNDAMELFRHSASLGEKSSDHIPEPLLRKIVDRCKGFPLAIKVVGRSLCGQPIEIWHQRVIEWSKGSSVLDFETELLLCLQSSFDALDTEEATIKECFLDLGSFPEDKRIPVAALIDMWAELYEIDEDILCIANLYRLTSRSLANLVVTRKEKMGVDGYYTEHFVTQHDMLRDLAIYQTKEGPIEHRKRLIIDIHGDNIPKRWREQRDQPMKARLLSISTGAMFSTKWHNMQLPEVEVLVLNFQTENYALPEFVEKMDKLKVVIVTNYGFLPAELSNFQLLNSLSSLKRIRLERVSIPSITKNPLQLKSLEKISLFMCNIGQAFSNGSIKALPNLEELHIDYCNDLAELPAELCDLYQLKKLSITNCHKLSALPEGIGKLVNLELLRLRSCTDLSELPGSVKNLKKLKFLDISDCFSIKELPEDIGEISSILKLNMRQCSRLQELPLSVSDLKQLEEVICDEETKNLWEPFLASLKKDISINVAKENINLNWLHRV